MKDVAELSQYIAAKLATAQTEEVKATLRDEIAAEIHADKDGGMLFLMAAKSGYTPDETIIFAKVNELFGGLPVAPYKEPSKAKRKLKIVAACIYSLLWVAGATACIVSSSLFCILIGNTWGYNYGDMTVRSCNLLSASGLTTSMIVSLYMWFSLLGIQGLFLSPSWLVKKLGLDE